MATLDRIFGYKMIKRDKEGTITMRAVFIVLLCLILLSPGFAAQAVGGGGWLLNYDISSPVNYIDALAVYEGKLYAGTCCNSGVYVYDGTSWTLNFVADNGDSH